MPAISTLDGKDMTLVVGTRIGERLELLSDTRISHPDVTQVEEIPGRLKIVILRPELCVAYAGRADYAIDAIRQLAAGGVVSVAEAAPRLHRTHVESGNAIDFLVAYSQPEVRLVLIRAGHTTEVPDEAWIGDADGAEIYARSKETVPVPTGTDPEEEALIRCLGAFSAVLAAPAIPTVAGLQVRVASTPVGFAYREDARAYFPSQSIPSGVETPLRFGGPGEGGFAYTLLVPQGRSVAIVAVHFYQGRLGYVYAPLKTDRPVAVPNVGQNSLRLYVRQQFGVEVQGIQVG